ncbi:hypothetical protein K8O93_01225 [Gordonia bronchialis]|uniref:LtfC-like domain-containing protein n=1 Tax=Gordonia bronchialis TaxID=2054 RepID=UPI001CC0DA6B|nr:hypothetical protein [Gordonia bronchialis]UAK38456.1 hypothetical protein K8O93_01225 [Gordonia bronchialis]
MAEKLGYVPNRGTIILSRGADWVCSLTDSAPWDADTEVWVEVEGVEEPWQAVVNEVTSSASFVVQSADTDPVQDGAWFRLYMRKPGSPSTEYLWWYGTVMRAE